MLDLCINCMLRLDDSDEICPNCKFPRDFKQPEPFMPSKKILGKRYLIGKGLKQDPEGLSYIGYDFIKRNKVHIREFFPCEICRRDTEKVVLKKDTPENKNKYYILLKDFCKYFRNIAKLRNLSAIVAIYDILEENGTCYIISEWIENGKSLDIYLSDNGGYLTWKQARILFIPVISSLIKMHAAGVYHLGIAPCNILINEENKIKLTGFATKNLRSNGIYENSELFDGCSALEQYSSDYKISTATDVYGFSASLFFALTGDYPTNALIRKKKDKLLMPSDIMKEIPDCVVTGLANALRVYPNSRTISFDTLKVELLNSPIMQVKNIYENSEDFNVTTSKKEKSNYKAGIISCAISLVILLSAFAVYFVYLKDKNSNLTPNSENNISMNTDLNSENLTTNQNESETKIEVPNLVGKTETNAKNGSTSEKPYSVKVLSEEFHDTIEKGKIISQNPAFGEKMYPGSVINVSVSKGPKKRILPIISGKTLSEVSLLLTEFEPSQINQKNDKVPEGIVIGYKDYQAGDLVDYGSKITIIVSKG